MPISSTSSKSSSKSSSSRSSSSSSSRSSSHSSSRSSSKSSVSSTSSSFIDNLNLLKCSDGNLAKAANGNLAKGKLNTSCPEDACISLPSNLKLTIAGLTGNCAFNNGDYTIVRAGSTCFWSYTQPGTEGYCDSPPLGPGSIVIIEIQCVPAFPTPNGQWRLQMLLAPGEIVEGVCRTTGQLCSAEAESFNSIFACGCKKDNDPYGTYNLQFFNMTCPSDCVDAIFTATISKF